MTDQSIEHDNRTELVGKLAEEFLQKYRDKLTALKVPADQLERQAWEALARALLSGNEFVFVD